MPAAAPPETLCEALVERARRSLRRRDPVLGALIRRAGPCEIESRGAPYEALVQAVIHQQLAGSAASAIAGRVRRHFGGRGPKPAQLAAASDAELRGLGLSRQKAASLREVAGAFADGRLSNRALRRMDDAAVVEAVTRLRGIGEWTAHMLLMFSLARPDVLPVGDYGVRKGAMLLYGLEDLPKPKELAALAEPWRPYRSVAAWYLWRHDAIAPTAA